MLHKSQVTSVFILVILRSWCLGVTVCRQTQCVVSNTSVSNMSLHELEVEVHSRADLADRRSVTELNENGNSQEKMKQGIEEQEETETEEDQDGDEDEVENGQ